MVFLSFRSIIALVLISCSAPIWAQDSWRQATSGRLVLETNGVLQDQPFQVGFLIELQPGWHTYWKNSGESGSGPKFQWQDTRAEIKGPHFPAPHFLEDAGIITFGYSHRVLLVFDHPGLTASETLKVSAEWLVCKEICMPAIVDVELEVEVLPADQVKPSMYADEFERTRRQWPVAVPVKISSSELRAVYEMVPPESWETFDFFPYRSLPFESLKVLETKHEGPASFVWSMGLKSQRELQDLGGIAVFRSGDLTRSFEVGLPSGSAVTEPLASRLMLLVLAFLGGLILNLMPCVFPILSLKLFGILKSGHNDWARIRKENLSYVVGVLIAFVALGFALSLIRGVGAQVGWGFQLQSPVFVGSLVILFSVLSMEMLGFFEMSLIDPNRGHRLTRLEGLWGAFFTGVLAVVVASPCAAPFMGVAVGAALAQKGFFGMLVFACLGLGLAFPYLILALSPKFLSWLPKPGPWMKTLKEFMAFPLLFTAVWLVWIFTQIAGAESLLLLLGSLVGVLFSIWVARSFKVLGWILAALILIGFFIQTSMTPQGETHAPSQSEGDWLAFNESLLAQRKPGEVQFVNMTADWCLTCKVNERLVFKNDSVEKFFKDHKIQQIKGDWTRRDPSITAFLDRFQRAGVPFYVIFSDRSPQGEPLSEVMTVDGFLNSLKKHLNSKKEK